MKYTFLKGSPPLAVLALLLTCANTSFAQDASLSIRVPFANEDLVGYAFNYGGDDFYWFVVPKGGSTAVPALKGGTYYLKLLCPRDGLTGRELTVDLKAHTKRTAVFRISELAPALPRNCGPPDDFCDAATTEIRVEGVGPGDPGRFYYRGCELQDYLRPLLVHKQGLIATGREIVDVMSGSEKSRPTDVGALPLRTPTELLLAELILIEASNLRAVGSKQVEQLLNDKAQLWSQSRSQVLGKELLSDASNRAFLGVLVAAVDRHELGVGESSIITVQYLSSDQSGSGQKKASYELEVRQEPPLGETDVHARVSPMHDSPSQEIAPEVNPGLWMFSITALPKFAGCVVGLRYTLWKMIKGAAPQKVRSGQFPGDLRLEATPVPPPARRPTTREKIERWAKEYREWVAWGLASALALLQIAQIAAWFSRRVADP